MIDLLLVASTGLLAGSWIAYSRELRLGGVVVVPLVATYTLISWVSLPIFVLGTVVAYGAIRVVQLRRLLYGRALLLVAIVTGGVVPILAYSGIDVVLAGSPRLEPVEVVGSILPGIAAYNFYRQDGDRRLTDVVVTAGVFTLTAVLGVATLYLWTTPPCLTCGLVPGKTSSYVTPALLQSGSDLATALGRDTVERTGVGTVGRITAVVVLGFLASEFVRYRWGVRPLGVVAFPLVAVFALEAWWMLPLYLTVVAVSYLAIRAVHRWTLLYGRVLLSLSVAFGILVTVPVYVALGLRFAEPAFYTGLLAGVGAYNFHVVPPWERSGDLVVNAGLFAVLFAIARALVSPLPAGLASSVGVVQPFVGGVAVLAGAWVLYTRERRSPDRTTIREQRIFVDGGSGR